MTGSQRSAGVTLSAQHVLCRTGWFSEQPEDFQNRIKALAHWRRFRAGENLYEVGDRADAVFGLEDGLVDVAIPISSDEMVNIWRAKPGFWVGDSALFSDNPRGVSLTANVDSLVLVIPGGALRRHFSETPHDIVFFYKLSHVNVMLALSVLSEVIALPPRARFSRMLLRMASDDGVVRVTQAELGSMAGMSRAAFRRAFSELIGSGVLRTEYGAVRIVDREALSREANARLGRHPLWGRTLRRTQPVTTRSQVVDIFAMIGCNRGSGRSPCPMVVASIPAVQAFATRGCAARHLLDENPIEWGEAAAMLPRSGIGRRTGMAPRASAACALCAA